jgi:hypothetical protein
MTIVAANVLRVMGKVSQINETGCMAFLMANVDRSVVGADLQRLVKLVSSPNSFVRLVLVDSAAVRALLKVRPPSAGWLAFVCFH